MDAHRVRITRMRFGICARACVSTARISRTRGLRPPIFPLGLAGSDVDSQRASRVALQARGGAIQTVFAQPTVVQYKLCRISVSLCSPSPTAYAPTSPSFPLVAPLSYCLFLESAYRDANISPASLLLSGFSPYGFRPAATFLLSKSLSASCVNCRRDSSSLPCFASSISWPIGPPLTDWSTRPVFGWLFTRSCRLRCTGSVNVFAEPYPPDDVARCLPSVSLRDLDSKTALTISRRRVIARLVCVTHG